MNRKLPPTVAALATVMAIGAVALTVLVLMRPVDGPDVSLTRSIQSEHGVWLLDSMRAVSLVGTTVVMIALNAIAAALLITVGRRREAVFLVVLSVSMALLTQLVKAAIGRPRPSAALVAVYERPANASFPSGHVTAITVFVGFLALVALSSPGRSKVFRIATVALSCAVVGSVGISRIYLGAHWFIDVVGGYLIAGVVLLAAAALYARPATASDFGREAVWDDRVAADSTPATVTPDDGEC